jgi:hypothetical protein
MQPAYHGQSKRLFTPKETGTSLRVGAKTADIPQGLPYINFLSLPPPTARATIRVREARSQLVSFEQQTKDQNTDRGSYQNSETVLLVILLNLKFQTLPFESTP